MLKFSPRELRRWADRNIETASEPESQTTGSYDPWHSDKVYVANTRGRVFPPAFRAHIFSRFAKK